MSMELMVQAMKVKVGNPLRKLVLLKLADNASDQGECWPSYQHIADQCEISRRSVMNHVAALCESGLMRKETRSGPKGNGSNFYRLTLSGANTSVRVVQEIHQDGEANSPGAGAGDSPDGATLSPGDSEGDSPRISHSSESVKEPENNSCPDASLSDEQLTKDAFLNRHPEAVVAHAGKRQWGSKEDLTCAQWMWNRIVKLYEKAAETDGELVRPKEPNWAAWSNEIRLMCAIDGRTHKQICEMFSRVQRDPFWCRNVMSPSKLREKWDDLILRLPSAGAAQNQAGFRDINRISRPDSIVPPGFRG
ncbi:helix-turn-helix domain-containing protein [Enterobacter sp. P82]|uniref:helix-turn-helix domain-containing protein n=1 Tax=Enterobacter sp. P82 TaxID=3123033 RepID=UPI00300C9654